MFYDNIQYVKLLNNFFNYSQSIYFKHKLEQTISFINNEFKTKYNLLGSAYDADSEGIEGKFYVWSYFDLEKILLQDFKILNKKFNITKNGNFEGNNILVENDNIQLNSEDKKIKFIESKLLEIRNKRKKPFFDNKVQTDLNCYWIYTLFHSSFILNDEKLLKLSNNLFLKVKERLKNRIFHCYDKNEKEINVFLEDYVYFAQLLIAVYEINKDLNSLDIAQKILKDVWSLFFNQENNVLQKNPKNNNDLFVNPIDLVDNNIPNGNSIYLLACNKIFNITNDSFWKRKIEILSKSFHSAINMSYSQMFSYIKVLSICDDNITFTFFGDNEKLIDIKKYLLKNYYEISTIIYKENKVENFILVCKNQICSQKLKSLNEVKDYLNEKSI